LNDAKETKKLINTTIAALETHGETEIRRRRIWKQRHVTAVPSEYSHIIIEPGNNAQMQTGRDVNLQILPSMPMSSN
jgi:hypothetical protein